MAMLNNQRVTYKIVCSHQMVIYQNYSGGPPCMDLRTFLESVWGIFFGHLRTLSTFTSTEVFGSIGIVNIN